MFDNFFKNAMDHLDGYLTGRLVVDEGQVLLATNEGDIAIGKSDQIEILWEDFTNKHYTPVTYKDVLERKTDAGWHLFAGFDARVMQIKFDMTVGEMLGFTNRFKSIVNSKVSDWAKNKRLSGLMTDLEGAYEIPLSGLSRRIEFEKQNPHVMQLYRTVSEARTL